MTALVRPISIKDYLDLEDKEASDNRTRWAREFKSFCELGDLYQVLASSIKITKKEHIGIFQRLLWLALVQMWELSRADNRPMGIMNQR